MKLLLATVAGGRGDVLQPTLLLRDTYVQRCARYLSTEHREFRSEAELLRALGSQAGRTRPQAWLADSRGTMVSSEELAASLAQAADSGIQLLALAIGPADGWSSQAREDADRLISFGRITLPHALASVIAAEQLYRALTIRAGHPYHGGH